MSGIMSMLLGAVSSAAAAVDEFFNRVTLLLPGDGTNGAQNNTFLDSSTNNFSITRNGNTTQGTFSPFSQTGWSVFLDSSGDYFTSTATTLGGASVSTFTIDGWIFPTTFANTIYIIGDMEPTGGSNFLSVNITTSGAITLTWFDGASKTCTSTGTLTLNQWNYFAVRVSSNAITIHANSATAGQTGTTTLTNRTGTSNFAVGAFSNSATPNAYLSNVRVSTVARTISIPTSAFSNDADTRFLLFQSNRFINNGSTSVTITPFGNTSVQAFSPFLPTAAYSAATVGGSGFFDGTGDMLETPSITIGTNNFCFECWLYPTATQGATTGIFVANTNNGLQLSYFGTTGLGIAQKGVVFQISGTGLPIVNAWNHVAFVRSGTGTNETSIFLNGVRIANGTVSYSYAASLYQLSTTNAGGTVFQGYIAGARLTNGSTPYDATQSTITIPTSPPTTSATNTSLLLNFTNAGITDATAKNDLETVGNAQISTTQSKFGGSSMSFDGTGDWLLVPHNVDQMFGTGAFTVEFWLYLNATGAARGLVAKGTGTTGWLVSLDSSNRVVFTYTTSTITSTGTISGTTWAHIAVVREGTGTNQTKIYINGTNDGTATVSTDFNQTNSMYVGADRTGGSALNGYIDDLRITKGYARYTANFTAPTSAFPLQ